jgi:hypothetical protein
MTPQKLADWLQDKTIYLWDIGDEQYYASPICEDIVPTLRQQQAEIEALKDKLYLAQKSLSITYRWMDEMSNKLTNNQVNVQDIEQFT